MGQENPVLVLASGSDTQFTMLNGLPHIVCRDVAMCAHAVKDATVILQWSGTRELLRETFALCPKVRWVHSRAAGVDNLLFPELVNSTVPLTNPLLVSGLSFLAFIVSSLAGLCLVRSLPETQMTDRNRDLIKEVRRMLVTLASLTLGLIIASATTSFEQRSNEVEDSGSKIIALESTLSNLDKLLDIPF